MDSIRILVVDDNIVARYMLIRLLKTESDFQIVGEADNGQAGMLMLEEARPDVVMLEAVINESISIFDVIKEIKQFRPEIKIIVCADIHATNHVVLATEVGAEDFVVKPYQKDSVIRAVRNAVARS